MDISGKVADLVLNAGKLPGYRAEPVQTYSMLQQYGIRNVCCARDVYAVDLHELKRVAKQIVKKHRLRFALLGMATGAPGQLVAVIGGTLVDLEEYVRRLFLLAQELGQIYGLIPNPFLQEHGNQISDYFESVKEELLKAILIGLGAGGITLGIVEVAKSVATKEARQVVNRKVSEQALVQLAKAIGEKLGYQVTKTGTSRAITKFIPVIGGIVNAGFNYYAINIIGERLIRQFEKEHIQIKDCVHSA